jgi:hypothetical protein
MSIASKRMSYMTELRSKRDKSDTASLMTVDEITAEVENRRVSKAYERDEELDGWTKVDTEIEDMVPKAVVDDDGDVEVEASDTSEESSEEDETLHEQEELSLDVDDDGCIRNVQNAKTGAPEQYFLIHFMLITTKSQQVDKRCSHWCWLIRQSLSRHGCVKRFAHGCKAS